ncbi:MAG: hypothetical protein ABIE55_03090 [Candidatus Aenigmatarchaeota archaeon]
MSLLSAFMPSNGKILGIIIIFALIATYSFVPILTSSVICSTNCSIEIGWPLNFLIYTFGTGTESFMDFNTIVFVIDIMVFYLVLCLISLIFKIGRKKNVPNNNSGGRDSSPADQAGP